MSTKTCRLMIVFATAAICVTNLGCAAFECKGLWPAHKARLDDDRTIHLDEYVQYNAVLRGPRYNFAELTLVVVPEEQTSEVPACKGGLRRPGGSIVHTVARRGAKDSKSLEQFKFGRLEARSNTARDRVWFIDTDASRVVATLDCGTGATTGPDDQPPPWATLDGGVRLEPIKPD
jgi:hypothetical protein